MQPEITQHLPANTDGRDFIIGDLHGCYNQLVEKLNEAKFDSAKDRLLSVGDLVDRGPQSMECLRLLNQPWFFAVRGNHESMLLNYLGLERAYLSSRNDFIDNGGNWVESLTPSERIELQEIAQNRVKNLPYQIKVEHNHLPFFVTHSGHGVFGEPLESPSEMEELSNATLEQLLWERDYFRECLRGADSFSVKAKIASYSIGLNRTALDHNPLRVHRGERLKHLVYAGHNALRIPILSNSHYFIDTGCGKAGSLTLIEHQRLLNKISDMI